MSAAYKIATVRTQLGASDCEALGDGLLAQPANALSSGVYIVVGAWLVWRAVSSRRRDRAGQVLFGLLVAAVGVGSGAFHGPMPAGARFLHDVTIAAVLGFIAVRGIGLMRGWSQGAVFRSLAVLTAVVGVVIAVAPDVAVGVIGVMGAAALGIEVTVHRAAVPGKPSPRGSRWLLVGLALLAVAGFVNVLGRTDGPWCDPASVLQPHAAWHVLTAAVFGLYGSVAFPNAPHPASPVSIPRAG